MANIKPRQTGTLRFTAGAAYWSAIREMVSYAKFKGWRNDPTYNLRRKGRDC